MKNIIRLTAIGVLIVSHTTMANAVGCSTVFPDEHCAGWSQNNYTCTCVTCASGYCHDGKSKKVSYAGETYNLYDTCTTTACSGSGGSGGADVLCNSATNPCRYQSITLNGQLYCRLKDSTAGCKQGDNIAGATFFSKYCEDYYGVSTGGKYGCYVFACKNGYEPNSGFTDCVAPDKCAQGYYKAGATCQPCPKLDDVAGKTAGTGATAITECYIPSGSAFSDDIGDWKYTSDCYYSN